jgi:copper oxidase (laccase) domain-containing protein
MEALFFPHPLDRIAGVRAAWIGRIPEIPVTTDRDEALKRLRPEHERRVASEFLTGRWWRAAQVHGDGIAMVPGAETVIAGDGLPVVPDVDGLLSNTPGEVLGIYVADCGPIWLADQKTGAVGLLHSGKKGTELNILGKGVRMMAEHFGTRPVDLVAVLGPCIRPPNYEVDIPAAIRRQAEEAGIGDFHDSGIDTACSLDQNYSYRMEKGQTGRMLALIQKLPA